MRHAKVWLLGLFLAAMICGSFLAANSSSADAQDRVVKSHWRHHDGHWNYWHEGDKRWYYTDGTNWFYATPDADAWQVYSFDQQFGRDGFERGEYRVPAAGVKIEVPRHRYYRPQ